MDKIRVFFLIAVICLAPFSTTYAAQLSWKAVETCETCTIAGYKVYYGTSSANLDQSVDAGDATTYDLSTLSLDPATTYYFAVSAYTTAGIEGSPSDPISYLDSPDIVGTPVMDQASGIIEITFSESNMQGANLQSNYSFSPSLIFDPDQEILQINNTYRLYMDYLPAYTIITMTISNITDAKGNALLTGSVKFNDDDNDGMADDWEAQYELSSPLLDADADGLSNLEEFTAGTSPVSNDTDQDGMDDQWELQNGLNPLADDAQGDLDGDGISNIDEYNGNTGAQNRGPDTPTLNSPSHQATSVSLTPELVTNAYVDNEGDEHVMTQWQITTDPTFADSEAIVFAVETYEDLTSIEVPEFILDAGQTYYWRVKFFDLPGGSSDWSEAFSFTTIITNEEDSDGDGVPDEQEVTDGTVDLNEDGYLDISSDTYKLVKKGPKILAMQASSNVTSVECLKSINPSKISKEQGKPESLPFNLIQFRITVAQEGDTAEIIIYFSEPVGQKWYKYDLATGWTDYSADYPGYVQFASDGKSVTIRLVDGGPGDSDGVANGIIVDPSGPGQTVAAATPSTDTGSSGEGGGGGGGCFIATAAFGSPIEKHVQILKDFRDQYLLKSKPGTAFVHAYYKYSPPIADVIAENFILRALVRVALMPLILFSYILINFSGIEISLIFLIGLSLSSLIFIKVRYRRLFREQSAA